MNKGLTRIVLPVLMVLWPGSAFAHLMAILGDDAGGFIRGLEHPVLGLDHILAIVAVGLWGALLGAPAIWMLPLTFLIVMAYGGVVAPIGLLLPDTEIGIALSTVALGAMIAIEARPPLWVAMLLVGFFAIFHGQAHATDLRTDGTGLLYVIDYGVGFVVAAGLLNLTGIAIGLIHRWTIGKMALRLAGAGASIAGAILLWGTLT